jgi:hypothetical protein
LEAARETQAYFHTEASTDTRGTATEMSDEELVKIRQESLPMFDQLRKSLHGGAKSHPPFRFDVSFALYF